jgi:hypothetical protein
MPSSTNRPQIGGSYYDKTAELLMAIMSSSFLFGWVGEVSTLPRYVDDAERDFGMDIYDRMFNDDSLSSSFNTIKIDTLSEGPKFMTPITAPPPFKPDAQKQALYEKAEEIKNQADRMFDRLQQPLEDILKDMLDALMYGHRLAEKVYAAEGGQLILKKLKVKERESYTFVQDRFGDFHGVLPTSKYGTNAGGQVNVNPEDVIPLEKFFILTYNSRGGNLKGRSIFRPAYNPWWLKQQLWPHYAKYLMEYATPSIAGITPPDAPFMEDTDEAGNVLLDTDGQPKQVSSEEVFFRKLLAFINGSVVVLPNGSDIKPIQVQGNGEAFLKAFEMLDRRCVRTVLLNTRATMEAEFGSKADSQTGQDLQGKLIQLTRRWVEINFYRDLLYPWVLINYGQETADTLCPYMSLSTVSKEDQVERGNMIANLARSQFLHRSQYQGIDADLGLPERDVEAMAAEEAERRDIEKMTQGLFTDPAKRDEDEEEEEE